MQTWMEIRLPGLDGAGWLAGAAVLGLALGSFLNVVLARLPAGTDMQQAMEDLARELAGRGS
ncbi:hypothetical protein WLU98_23880, partial [Bordetella bronchiseptica]